MDDADGQLLVNELLDDDTPFLLMPTAASPRRRGEDSTAVGSRPMMVYSGPTLGDIEHALSTSFRRVATTDAGDRPIGSGPPMATFGERNVDVARAENNSRYTLKIKSCTNGMMTDDGYKWRKYGQKSIKNSPNPRSYYRCTNPRCNAKKQVEKSVDDPEVFVVTYEGLHLHYAHPHFLAPQPQPALGAPIPKKLKIQPPSNQQVTQTDGVAPTPPLDLEFDSQQAMAPANDPTIDVVREDTSMRENDTGLGSELCQVLGGEDGPSTQGGLLEDIVPLLMRNPGNDMESFLEDLGFPSQPSSPVSSSSSCLSMSPVAAYFDAAIHSTTL